MSDKDEATRLADALLAVWPHDEGRVTREAAAALLRRWPDGEPVAYQYLFDGYNGPVWRNDSGPWNGMQPKASRPLYPAPPDQSERIAALERKGAESKRPTVAIGAKASEWKTLSPQAQALIQQAAQKAVDRWSEQQKLDGAARAATPLVPLGASDLDRAHGGIDDRIAALEAENAEWKAKAATWLASPEAASRLQGYRELTERIAALEAALEQARVALRHGIKTINHLGGAVECMPLHEALRAIEEAQHG